MKFSHQVKRLFHRLTVKEMAQQELADAEIELHQAQTGLEWSASMVQYHTTRIARLRAQLATNQAPAPQVQRLQPVK